MTKIIISESQYNNLFKIITESNPVINLLKSFQNAPVGSAGRATANALENSLDSVVPNISTTVTLSSGQVGRISNGKQLLKAFTDGILTPLEQGKVVEKLFTSTTNDDLMKALAKNIVNGSEEIRDAIKSGTSNLDDFRATYGIAQTRALFDSVMSKKYQTIFDTIPPNQALKFIEDAVSFALSKGEKTGISTIDKKKKILSSASSPEQILDDLIDGRLEDIERLRVMILNTFRPGPTVKSSAKTHLENNLMKLYLQPDTLKALKGFSIGQIEQELLKSGITNPEVAKKVWKAVNPDEGIGMAFRKGLYPLESQGPLNYIFGRFVNPDKLKEANPVFKSISNQDLKRLIQWGFTGIGDNKLVIDIFKTYGFAGAVSNVMGQALKTYIASSTMLVIYRSIINGLSAAGNRKKIYPDQWEAFKGMLNKDQVLSNSFWFAPLSQALGNLGMMFFRLSQGGQLSVEVYDFIDEIKKSIPLLEREVENSKNVLDKDMKKVIDDLEKDVTLKGVTPKTTKPDSTATKTDSVTTSTTKGRNPGN